MGLENPFIHMEFFGLAGSARILPASARILPAPETILPIYERILQGFHQPREEICRVSCICFKGNKSDKLEIDF